MPRLPALIVEEDLEKSRWFKKYLELCGFVVEDTDSTAVAQQKIQASKYALLILNVDVGTSIGEGLWLLGWMRRSGKTVPTVVFSRQADSHKVITAISVCDFVLERLPADDFAELTHVLDNYIDRLLQDGRATMASRLAWVPASNSEEGQASAAESGPPFTARTIGMVLFSLAFSAVGCAAALAIMLRFADLPAAGQIAFAFIVFTTVCGVVYMYGERVVLMAVRIWSHILGGPNTSAPST